MAAMNAEPAWATQVRQLARVVAAELTMPDSVDRNPDAVIGWSLWSGTTRRGSTEPRGSGDAYLFQSWSYTTTLALRTDGELVTFQEIEGMQSPNDAGSHGIRLATNDSLSYPDVTRWRDQREVEEAPIRKITDIYSIPEEYAEPCGVGVTKALEVLRTEHRMPQPLVLERRSATPAARPRAARRRCGFSTGGMFFGMWLGGFAAAMSIIGLTHLGRSRAIVDMSYVLFASLVVLGGVVCGRVFAD